MERFVRSLRILWRSERLLVEQDVRLGARRIQFNALAGLVGLFGLVMLSLASFFALVPYWGEALAALAVAVGDLVLAAGLIAYARSLTLPAEIDMVREVRDIALSDLEEEMALAEEEIASVKADVQKFVANPVDALLPGLVGPLVAAIARGLASARKQ
jgi:hypothetical protein